MSDCYGSRCSIGDWQANTTAPSVEQQSEITSEYLCRMLDELHAEVTAPIYKGQRDKLQEQVRLLRLRFHRYLREQQENAKEKQV